MILALVGINTLSAAERGATHGCAGDRESEYLVSEIKRVLVQIENAKEYISSPKVLKNYYELAKNLSDKNECLLNKNKAISKVDQKDFLRSAQEILAFLKTSLFPTQVLIITAYGELFPDDKAMIEYDREKIKGAKYSAECLGTSYSSSSLAGRMSPGQTREWAVQFLNENWKLYLLMCKERTILHDSDEECW